MDNGWAAVSGKGCGISIGWTLDSSGFCCFPTSPWEEANVNGEHKLYKVKKSPHYKFHSQLHRRMKAVLPEMILLLQALVSELDP